MLCLYFAVLVAATPSFCFAGTTGKANVNVIETRQTKPVDVLDKRGYLTSTIRPRVVVPQFIPSVVVTEAFVPPDLTFTFSTRGTQSSGTPSPSLANTNTQSTSTSLSESSSTATSRTFTFNSSDFSVIPDEPITPSTTS
ncbi:hypothetical protein H4219_005647 [Mycoemilia scoparia]|uniref:Uncharacterized protein n=1 Tax=Mycoemilia scoparia TaxID=417184 RepID=A0A9W7ZWR8_9FUNG|nr:hypothetical protein H4219_005647 [Mycoemilia scoparia]